jgi:hypothetical protein
MLLFMSQWNMYVIENKNKKLKIIKLLPKIKITGLRQHFST